LVGSGIVSGVFCTHNRGTSLVDIGVTRTASWVSENSGGVVLVDDAHDLLDNKRVLQEIMAQVELRRGELLFILAGDDKAMRNLLGHGSKNIRSLFPHAITLRDYTDNELRDLLANLIKIKFNGKMQVEGGLEGLYMRIAARRLGRSRGSSHFGNVRDVENAFARIWERQSARLSKAREERSKDSSIRDTAVDSANVEVSEAQIDKRGVEMNKSPTNLEIENQKQEWIDVGQGEGYSEWDSASKSDSSGSNETGATEDTDTNLDSTKAADFDDYRFSKEDILGPDPSRSFLKSPAWTHLQRLTGMSTVKRVI
jgi:hypothetical protein